MSALLTAASSTAAQENKEEKAAVKSSVLTPSMTLVKPAQSEEPGFDSNIAVGEKPMKPKLGRLNTLADREHDLEVLSYPHEDDPDVVKSHEHTTDSKLSFIFIALFIVVNFGLIMLVSSGSKPTAPAPESVKIAEPASPPAVQAPAKVALPPAAPVVAAPPVSVNTAPPAPAAQQTDVKPAQQPVANPAATQDLLSIVGKE